MPDAIDKPTNLPLPALPLSTPDPVDEPDAAPDKSLSPPIPGSGLAQAIEGSEPGESVDPRGWWTDKENGRGQPARAPAVDLNALCWDVGPAILNAETSLRRLADGLALLSSIETSLGRIADAQDRRANMAEAAQLRRAGFDALKTAREVGPDPEPEDVAAAERLLAHGGQRMPTQEEAATAGLLYIDAALARILPLVRKHQEAKEAADLEAMAEETAAEDSAEAASGLRMAEVEDDQ